MWIPKRKMMMEELAKVARLGVAAAVAMILGVRTMGQDAPSFSSIQTFDGGELRLKASVANGAYCRIERSVDLREWRPMVTARSTGTLEWSDFLKSREEARTQFYRVRLMDASVATVLGDHVATEEGDAVIRPINHASAVVAWNGKWIYNDPVGGATPYQGIPKADVILVSHSHGDHSHTATLEALRKAETILIAPSAVYLAWPAGMRSQGIAMANGAKTNVMGLTVEAVPAYNANHPKGTGNGYVVTLGGKRLYFAGDTEDVPEMRALSGIDVAFLCMNVPFTMTVSRAASAVRAFRPAVVYPYHYRNSDGTFANLTQFRNEVGLNEGIEVRLRKWY